MGKSFLRSKMRFRRHFFIRALILILIVILLLDLVHSLNIIPNFRGGDGSGADTGGGGGNSNGDGGVGDTIHNDAPGGGGNGGGPFLAAPRPADARPRAASVAAAAFGRRKQYAGGGMPFQESVPVDTPVKTSIVLAAQRVKVKLYGLFQLLAYKPPVGVVSAWALLRVVERLYGLWSPQPPELWEEALVAAEGRMVDATSVKSRSSKWWKNKSGRKKWRKKLRSRRSMDLDAVDRTYDEYGGVEATRARVCRVALQYAQSDPSSSLLPQFHLSASPPPTSVVEKNNATSSSTSTGSSLFGTKVQKEGPASIVQDPAVFAIKAALEALELSCPPHGSREIFVERSVEFLSRLSPYLTPPPSKDDGKGRAAGGSGGDDDTLDLTRLLRQSSKLVELRSLDSLLRALRDRQTVVSARLRRAESYRNWRVRLADEGGLGPLREVGRRVLLPIYKVLLSRWRTLDDERRSLALVSAACAREVKRLGEVEILLLRRPEDMEAGALLLVDAKLSEPGIVNDITRPEMSAVTLLNEPQNQKWIQEADEWTRAARRFVEEYILETAGPSLLETQGELNTTRFNDEIAVVRRWAECDATSNTVSSWFTVLSLMDYSTSLQREGEQRYATASRVAARFRRYDFLGIPSSALAIASASLFHNRVIMPHSGEIVDFVKSAAKAVWGIVEFRFYAPIRDIALDLLNRRPRMVDPFALMNEQMSLDNMLKDLGVGDGTRLNRAAALTAASRMYEQEVAGGALRGILRGKVTRLMLIQIQQLKSDLLQAMDSIDGLVDSNRLNVQIIASIPAMLIIYFGSRLFITSLSNIRMKDLRLPWNVHAEMSDFLKKAEECLILANHELDVPLRSKPNIASNRQIAVSLGPKDMGDFLLLIHSYLNLLDYMSPPFPSKACESIHRSVQNLLRQGQMSTTRQLELLKVTQSKHAELIKSL